MRPPQDERVEVEGLLARHVGPVGGDGIALAHRRPVVEEGDLDTYDASGAMTQTWGKNHLTDPNSNGSLGKLMTAEYDAEGRLWRTPYNKLDTTAGMASYDVTGDCRTMLGDQTAMGPSYNKNVADAAYNALYDFNSDGRVNLQDVTSMGPIFNTRCPTFVYDHDGQLARVEGRITAGQGTNYGPYDRVYIGGVYEKALKTGEVTKYYSLGGRRVAMSRGSATYYLANDHLGGTALVMDAAGNAVSRVRYAPYGQVWTQSAAPPTDKLFTGHTRVGVRSGLYYAGARFYSADLGRFPPEAGKHERGQHRAGCGRPASP